MLSRHPLPPPWFCPLVCAGRVCRGTEGLPVPLRQPLRARDEPPSEGHQAPPELLTKVDCRAVHEGPHRLRSLQKWSHKPMARALANPSTSQDGWEAGGWGGDGAARPQGARGWHYLTHLLSALIMSLALPLMGDTGSFPRGLRFSFVCSGLTQVKPLPSKHTVKIRACTQLLGKAG